MTVTYQLENTAKVIPDIGPLLERHYDEVCLHKQFALRPDYSRYRQLEDRNMLLVVTARDEGKLAGYAVFLMVPNIHYPDRLEAVNDVVFVDRAYRGGLGRVGMQLVRAAERYAIAWPGPKGRYIVWRVKIGTAWGRMLEHLGYKPEEVTYAKVVEAPYGR